MASQAQEINALKIRCAKLEARVDNLEDKVKVLDLRVTKLENANPTPIPPTQIIPLSVSFGEQMYLID